MNTNSQKAPAIKTHHHYLVLDGREQRHAPRKARTQRRHMARPIPNRALGNALLSAFVESGRKLTAGMRRDLGLDA